MEEKNQLFTEEEVVLHIPYNVPIERFFDKDNFEVKSFKRNGEKPVIIIRYKVN